MTMVAGLLQRRWRVVDVKIVVDGTMRLLRWRRGWLQDRLFLDEREVARVGGLFGRESVFGLVLETSGGDKRLLLTIDTTEDGWDFSGESAPRGVRLETAEETLLAFGSLDPNRERPFLTMFENAVRAFTGEPAGGK
ncbi:MAG: hypothetical protein AAFR11_06540 [Pseudomonadota bacterium]